MSMLIDHKQIKRLAQRAARKPANASQRESRPEMVSWVPPNCEEHGSHSRLKKVRNAVFAGLGLLMLLLGVVGAFVPVMPTTIFLILAAWFFGRYSPRLEKWILGHPHFGPSVTNWQRYGAVPRRSKWMACIGMAAGYVIFWVGAKPDAWLAALIASLVVASAAYVVTRPERTYAQQNDE